MLIVRALPLRQLILYLALGTVAIQSSLLTIGFLFDNPRLASSVANSSSAPDPAANVPAIEKPSINSALSQSSAPDNAAPELNSSALPDAPPAALKPTSPHSSYRVEPGDTLSKIWKKLGAPYIGGLRAGSALSESGIPGAALRAGEVLELEMSESGDIVLLRKNLRGGKILELRGDSTSGYHASISEIPSTESERTVSGSISSSFSAAASEAAVPYEVVDELVDIFGPRVEFRRALHRGDRFTIIYSERRGLDGQLFESGSIKAAAIEVGGVLLSAVRHVGTDKIARYYDENGEPLGNFFLRYPLQFSRISSVFSEARFHPVLKTRRPHNGVDFAAPVGTAVRSVADGIVEVAGMRGGGGLTVFVRHSDRYTTAYLHLSKINVHRGARVQRGQIIGAVGTTGLSTGPHLHFSLYDRGEYVDPMKAELPRLAVTNDKIPPPYLTATLATLRQATNGVVLAATSDQGKAAS